MDMEAIARNRATLRAALDQLISDMESSAPHLSSQELEEIRADIREGERLLAAADAQLAPQYLVQRLVAAARRVKSA